MSIDNAEVDWGKAYSFISYKVLAEVLGINSFGSFAALEMIGFKYESLTISDQQ